MAYPHALSEPIAIVGMGCRFPGKSDSPSKLWDLLRDPYDLSKTTPENRFHSAGFYHPDGEHHGTTNATQGYWLEEDHRSFDASFFRISNREAEAIDPQQRILLETVYEALENGGFSMQDLQGSQTSVFVGTMTADFHDVQFQDTSNFSQYVATGVSRSIISNRISYCFDWRGPSMTIDTACSSSLVALHQAIQGLRTGESHMGCVAGANLMLSPEQFIAESSLHMLSPTGKSQMWDINANGYARGEGTAVILLKTLSRALADGDHIDAIIRETGVNSDGQTPGITMPSSDAQAALIRRTYSSSGLDSLNPAHQCQYFEAHGTGTQAGDPREAAAIAKSFFPSHDATDNTGDLEHMCEPKKLLVGSVKTVIGHTEGAAGLAGVLKVCLAMKNGAIPPNQHFHELNPSVAPSYVNLHIPTTLTTWPKPAPGHPMRASVNSFGFGGTNAHAIIESYEPQIHSKSISGGGNGFELPVITSPKHPELPILFSAQTDKALKTMLQNFFDYLQTNETVEIRDVAWTLATRRSSMAFRTFFSVTDRDDLLLKMTKKLSEINNGPNISVGVRGKAQSSDSSILGGQGAQWAEMGKSLIENSPMFDRIIRELEDHLKNCADPPTWSLRRELLADPASSRLGEATISQPACTALQVALTDVMRLAGVKFHTVIGHSSGEIGAAYAAQLLTAKDAILIAYYRGVHTKLAEGNGGTRGSMMAVGLGAEDALDLCDQLQYRIVVAASNSATSVTLSGDADAINEAKRLLDERKVFARVLKIDKAYHSFHMDPCSTAYLESLSTSSICPTLAPGSEENIWISSVYGLDGSPTAKELSGTYWRDNMTGAVLFEEAVERAITERGPYDVIVEIGPHAALKGPVLQTLKNLGRDLVPYCGALDRNKDDIVALGECMGFLWAHLGPGAVNFHAFSSLFGDASQSNSKILTSFPNYPWDHDQPHYRESRLAKQYLRKTEPPHELLGVRTNDDNESELRWRNILKPNEIPWLRDHRFQGQIIVPAAAYCIMALDASRSLVTSSSNILVELCDVEILNATVIEEDSPGIETLFTLTRTTHNKSRSRKLQDGDMRLIEGVFSLWTTAVDGNRPMRQALSGSVIIHQTPNGCESLPPRDPLRPELSAIDTEKFYDSMLDIGLGYTGPFRGLKSIRRRLDASSATIEKPHPDDPCTLSVRPTMLDTCFQAVFAAFAAPGDSYVLHQLHRSELTFFSALYTAFLPQRIHRLRFNLALCTVDTQTPKILHLDANVTEIVPTTHSQPASFAGDIDIFNREDQMEMQIEGLTVASFALPSSGEDRELYLHEVWNVDISSGINHKEEPTTMKSGLDLVETYEKIVYFYLWQMKHKTHTGIPSRWRPFLKLLNEIVPDNEAASPTRQLRQCTSMDDIDELISGMEKSAELELIQHISRNLPSMIQSDEDELTEDLKAKIYEYLEVGIGMQNLYSQLESLVEQVAHRHPRMSVLELEARNGAATAAVLRGLDSTYASYTFTDRSDELFPTVKNRFQAQSAKMNFETLAYEQDAPRHSNSLGLYDLIICSMSLHGSASAAHSLRKIRQLLKPGGYLILLEPVKGLLRSQFLIAGLPQFWAHSQLPENLGATRSLVDYDELLRRSGFGGIDTTVFDFDNPLDRSASLIVAQAVDEYIDLVRQPLSVLPTDIVSGQILIVGGACGPVAKLATNIVTELQNFDGDVDIVSSLEDLDHGTLGWYSAAVVLADLDSPVFQNTSEKDLRSIQEIFSQVPSVLWITNGFQGENPYHKATLGLARCAVAEYPQLELQVLDIDNINGASRIVSESMIRLMVAHLPEMKSGARLWTTEPELQFEKGMLKLPRVMPLIAQNDRLNAARRVIVEDVDLRQDVVKICNDDDRSGHDFIVVKAGHFSEQTTPSSDEVTIRAISSSLYALKVNADAYLTVCAGINDQNGGHVVAFSKSNASSSIIPAQWQSFYDNTVTSASQAVQITMRSLVAKEIFRHYREGLILVHGADPLLARIVIETFPIDQRQFVFFTTLENNVRNEEQWITIHPRASKRVINRLLPRAPSIFVNLMNQDDDIPTHISETLPSTCVLLSREDFFQPSTDLRGCHLMDTSALLSVARHFDPTFVEWTDSVSPTDSTAIVSRSSQLTVIDWTISTVQTLKKSIDPKTLFSPTKSYLLVGMTGELGQSLCRFMVNSGARHLIMSSRNPPTQASWIDELHHLGANVSIEALDVTNKESTIQLADKLARTMPPIAGIVNGAMLLSDGLFADMTAETFNKVLSPKIDGSNNLDQAFASADLDFFIMTSSLSGVVGNKGQANYCVANMYMCGLAAQRRQRGLAASVVDIGMLIGLGYIRRQEGEEVYNNLRKHGYMPISERDIHHMFAEAIDAGHASTEISSEIITGLYRFPTDRSRSYFWQDNPRFSHHSQNSEENITTQNGGARETIKQQLAAVSSIEETSNVILSFFTTQLELMLQLPPSSLNSKTPIIELGVDSLVAVEIRTWFLKEVGKDVPVLKVLSGSDPASLCTEVATDLLVHRASTETSSIMDDGINDDDADDNGLWTPATEYSSDEERPISHELASRFQSVTKMSYGQSRMWFPSVYLEDKTTYNCTTSYTLTGLLNVYRFERSLDLVIQRHQALRASFYTDRQTGNAMQGTLHVSPFRLRKVESLDRETDVARETEKVMNHVYDLESGDVFVATLLQHHENLHTILFGYHHLICDGVSWQLFLQDLEKFYAPRIPKTSPPSQYIDFSIRQRAMVECGGVEEKRDYWRSQFFDDVPLSLPLFPFAKTVARKVLTRYETQDHRIWLEKSLVEKIKQASSAARSTSFHFYLAVLQVLLVRFLDIEDFCIGITDAARNDKNHLNTIGLLLDILPLRFRLEQGARFDTVLQATRSTVYEAVSNSGVPLEVILQDIEAPVSSTELPLFQVLVNYRMGALKQKSVGNIKLDWLEYEDAKHPFDFTLSIDETEDGEGALSLSLQKYLYDKEGGDLIMSSYINLLDVFSSAITMPVADSSLYDPQHVERALIRGMGPTIDSDWPETLALRVDQLVELMPEAIAIKDIRGVEMTYQEMSERVNGIATELFHAGVVPDARVATFFESSSDVICSLLAIMRLGAVYVPLDVRNAYERLNTIAINSGSSLVLCDATTIDRVHHLKFRPDQVINTSIIGSTTSKIPNNSQPDGLAFILFTSGTTGNPKGIMINNANFITHFASMAARMNVQTGKERVLQQSSFGYDTSLAQTFWALATGGTVVMTTNRGDMAELAALMARERITFCLLTPSEYMVLFHFGEAELAKCVEWRVAMCGGEAFPNQLKAKFHDLALPNLTLYNVYGPTEISVICSVGEVSITEEAIQEDSKVPIGPAIANYAVYIMDTAGEPVPLGAVGEIVVGGPGVAVGYLNNEQLTESKFVADTVSRSTESVAWSRLYRTGDKGRMLEDGSIIFLGRMEGDSMIKLRGIRIELDDIAGSILESSKGMLSAAAVIVKGESQQFLVAYVVFAPGKEPNQPLEYLKQLLNSLPLPQYMRPALVIPLERLPRSAGAKLDMRALKALPLPDMASSEAADALTPTQASLRDIWIDVLADMQTGVTIDRSTNFFSAGGNSLLLLRLQAEMRREFDVVVPLPELFQSGSLEQLASRIENSPKQMQKEYDWTAESALPTSIFESKLLEVVPLASEKPLSIVLTGATGFLGKSLLKQLEERDDVKHIYCIAVRRGNDGKERQLAVQSAKITIVYGDLSAPKLGMTVEQTQEIFSKCDAIIHNGAEVSHMQTYDTLRAPNVGSTRELASLALERRIPMHFVSTAGVATLTGDDSLHENSVSGYPPPREGGNGYISSKWVSERVLELAHEQLELPLTIYRPSNITGDDAPTLDINHNTMKYSRILRAVPDLSGWTGYLDLISVEKAARMIVQNVVDRTEPRDDSPARYVHVSGETVIPVESIRSVLEAETGCEYRTLNMTQWTAEAVKQGMKQLVAEYLNAVQSSGHGQNMPRILREQDLL